MSVTSLVGNVLLPNPSCTGAATSVTMDATGERHGFILQVTKTGSIANIYLRTGNVTEEDSLKVSLQGVGADGLPNGTILGAGSAGYTTVTMTDANDSVWLGPFALGANVAVTQGQALAVVVEWSSYSDGNLQLAGSSCAAVSSYNTYTVTDVAASPGTWAKGLAETQLAIALEFDDGTYMPTTNFGAGYIGTALSLGTGSTPDEIGNYFKTLVPVRAVGIWMFGDFDYDMTLSLQNAAGTVLANCTLEADYRLGVAVSMFMCFFDSDPAYYVDLDKDTYYRTVMSPTGADTVTPRYIDVPEAAAMGAFDLGINCVYTSRTDAGAWSQTDTRRAVMGLIVSHLSDGVGTGGGAINLDKMGAM